MATRHEVYRKFGPKQMEARDLAMKKEINLIRAELGLPIRTTQQIIDSINAELDTLPNYDWMS